MIICLYGWYIRRGIRQVPRTATTSEPAKKQDAPALNQAQIKSFASYTFSKGGCDASSSSSLPELADGAGSVMGHGVQASFRSTLTETDAAEAPWTMTVPAPVAYLGGARTEEPFIVSRTTPLQLSSHLGASLQHSLEARSRSSSSLGSGKQSLEGADGNSCCTICLEQFAVGERMRILPCTAQHECECQDAGFPCVCAIQKVPLIHAFPSNPQSMQTASTNGCSATLIVQAADSSCFHSSRRRRSQETWRRSRRRKAQLTITIRGTTSGRYPPHPVPHLCRRSIVERSH